MGEVFLATREGEKRTFVVKRVLPNLLGNPRFLRLFLDEMRIAARLDHPNIAKIIELAEDRGSWFVAMEYVDGLDLRELLKRHKEQGDRVPVEVAVHIAAGVAAALDYAHQTRDAQGRLLKIVHRDVSPHNVLVGRDGDVKLIDFGVAKATNKLIHTQAGMLKGKFPYMSPEQSHGKPVDARTDVFALGIVLWETLTNAYLFRGKSDAQTVKLVRAAQAPAPSTIRSDVPAALDAVVLKALRPEPRGRFQSAEALREALAAVAQTLPKPDLPAWFARYEDADIPGLAWLLDDEVDSADGSDVSTGRGGRTRDLDSAPQSAASGPSVVNVGESPLLRTQAERPAARRTTTREGARLLAARVASAPTNLPTQATSFVGRVAELADLQQTFRQGVRLLTLLGAGGSGKTRLAIQFAAQLVSHFQTPKPDGEPRGGVWFADLTSARDVEGLCAAVSAAIGVPLVPGDAARQLGHALAARGEVLVVLDNFEQIVGTATSVVQSWMTHAPEVRFVVTSRELLRVPHEVVYEVPPLRVGDGRSSGARSEAVQLFVERARTVRQGWSPSEADLLSITELVSRLEGLPLALELAAARMALLSPAQLGARLARRLDVLGAGKASSSHQATLRGTLDWSWELLHPSEARALARLSVFRGGFTAEAADAVVGNQDGQSVDAIAQLRGKSLVRSYFVGADEREVRFSLLETVREYAAEKLGSGEARSDVEQRHSEYFARWAAVVGPESDHSVDAINRLAIERPNLEAVFERAVDQRRPILALEMLTALEGLLTARGPFNVYLEQIERLMPLLAERSRAQARGLELRARALRFRGRVDDAERDFRVARELATQHGLVDLEGRIEVQLGTIDHLRGNKRGAEQRLLRAVELLAATHDDRSRGRALSTLAVVQFEDGRVREGLATYNEAIELHRSAGDRRHEGISLANLGVSQQAIGLLPQARVNYELALSIHREYGNRRSEGISHINLGDLHREMGEPAIALMHYEQALAILADVGAQRFVGGCLGSLGALHHELWNLDEAKNALVDAVAVLAEVGDKRNRGTALATLAAVSAARDRPERAEKYLAEAEELLRAAGEPAAPDIIDAYRAHLEWARSVFGAAGEDARALQQRATRRIARAEASGPPNAEHPSGTPAAAAGSEHVRSALRAFKKLVAKLDETTA